LFVNDVHAQCLLNFCKICIGTIVSEFVFQSLEKISYKGEPFYLSGGSKTDMLTSFSLTAYVEMHLLIIFN